MEQEVIKVLAEEYVPFYKFGVNRLLKLIEGKDSSIKEPIRLQIEDPIFGRILRLLGNNFNGDMIGQFDHHINIPSKSIDAYIRVKCIGGRIEDQRRYKGENER